VIVLCHGCSAAKHIAFTYGWRFQEWLLLAVLDALQWHVLGWNLRSFSFRHAFFLACLFALFLPSFVHLNHSLDVAGSFLQ
jgi:hypothetical protein